MNTIKKNPHILLEKDVEKLKTLLSGKWVSENTALLVIHGIGHQNPLETLDMFGRGLSETLLQLGGAQIYLTHEIVNRSNNSPIPEFENYIRIHRKDSDKYIDVYEYYWANQTENQAHPKDFQKWVADTSKGARKFYKENARLAKEYEADSPFLASYERFNYVSYFIFLYTLGSIIPMLGRIGKFSMKAIASLPFIGSFLHEGLDMFLESSVSSATNVVNDIVIYNTTDHKSKFFGVRKTIMDGAIKQLKYLIETPKDELPPYKRVIIAGHSLGTQVAFDAMNNLTHLVNKGEIKGYNSEGTHLKDSNIKLINVMCGFITFGSPLDKIAFFLRENVNEQKEYLRFQILCNYHSFKQRDWAYHLIPQTNEIPPPFHLPGAFNRIFDSINWRNYFDYKDYVSGSLDYYFEVSNVDCSFKTWNPFAFTHSWYWEEKSAYADMLSYIICDTTINHKS